jgi:hypothetical protein
LWPGAYGLMVFFNDRLFASYIKHVQTLLYMSLDGFQQFVA